MEDLNKVPAAASAPSGDAADQSQTIAALEADLAAEKEAHLQTLALNEKLQEQIETFEAEPKPAPKAEKVARVPDASFKVDKLDYVFIAPAFHYKGKRITAEQALSDKALLAELVAEKVGIIKRKNA